MTWTTADRHAFADLLVHLDAAPERVLAFLDDRRAALAAEAGADPGVDQVRAGLLRALADADDPDFSVCAEAAIVALRTYPEQIVDASPALLQRRHPAWVGLAAREAGLELAEAIELARAGFQAFAGPQGTGDVLWAMAEAAEDVDWAKHHAELLEAAVASDFLDPGQHDQVRLLWSLHRLENGDAAAQADAEAQLHALADDVDGEERTRIHALWVLAARARQRSDDAAARQALLAALALVDEDEEPDTAQRLRQALSDA